MKVPPAKLVTFLVVAGIIAFGPAYDRAVGGSPVLDRWDMFHRRGVGVCDAEFLDGRAASLPALDRFSVLATPRATAPKSLRRLDGADQIDEVTRRLCHAIGRDADVRVRGRCATSEGWVTTHDPGQNACKPARRATAAPGASEAADGE